MITLYLILNGYPSDKVVVPMTIVMVIMGIVMSVKGMIQAYENDN